MHPLKSGCLTFVAVVLVLSRHSRANVTAALSELAEEEKYLTNPKFQALQDAIIMKDTSDENSLVARSLIQAIREVGLSSKANGASPLAVDTVIEAIISVVRLVAAASRGTIGAIDEALNLGNMNPEAVTAAAKAIKYNIDLVFICGVPVHDAVGSALTLVGGAAKQGLKNTIISIQMAGNAAFKILEIAEQLVTSAIKASGFAAEESLKAAREAAATRDPAVYAYLYKAAQQACEGLRYAASKGPIKPGNLVPGIIESLKTPVVIDNSAALAAIARLNKGLRSVLSVSTKKTAVDAAFIMSQGLSSTILETADAMAVAKKALAEAGELAAKDTEFAVTAVRKGIKAAKDEVISGSAGGYLGIGAAGQFAGKVAIEGLIPAVFEIEYGRVAAYDDLELAEKISIMGLRAGGQAAVQGMLAALQICDAAGNALYTQYADGGEIGFDVLKSI